MVPHHGLTPPLRCDQDGVSDVYLVDNAIIVVLYTVCMSRQKKPYNAQLVLCCRSVYVVPTLSAPVQPRRRRGRADGPLRASGSLTDRKSQG